MYDHNSCVTTTLSPWQPYPLLPGGECYLDNLARNLSVLLQEDGNVITQQQQHMGRDLRHRLVVELKYTPNVVICSRALTTALPV